VELTLRPTQAWFGGGFVSAKRPYRELSFRAPGLHNILSTIHVDHQFLAESKPKRKSPTHQLKKLTGAQQAFLVYQLKQPSAKINRGGKSYQVVLASSIAQTSSSTEGINVKTSDFISIHSEGASLAELMGVNVEVEQFLCLLCVGPFRSERLSVQLDDLRSAELLWMLGRPLERSAFTLMPHQMLVPLGRHPDLAGQALEQWFKADEPTRLARWLIVEGLFTEESSTAKFLSVTQAWEILGREESNIAPYDKKKFKEACKQIDKILKGELGSDAAKRLLDLLRSSNRESFGDFVKNITLQLPELALNRICQNVPAFIPAVVSVRNVLTHMQGKKKMSIGAASYLSLFLTYKLLVLFCIHACVAMGLPLDNLDGMLANNRMARAACRSLPLV
jgi:hypothetical protein